MHKPAFASVSSRRFVPALTAVVGLAATACGVADNPAQQSGLTPPLQDNRATGIFEAPQPWTQAVVDLPKSASSDRIVSWLEDHGGWGTKRLRIGFDFHILSADEATPFRKFTPTEDFYEPDCDEVPFPVPAGGALESEDGYACESDGDCHLIVVHPAEHKLYEMWRADLRGDELRGGCAVVWDLRRSYPHGRGENCTSSDAGGFPVAAMTFSADEVARGSIDHALRFILPNSRIRRGVYVHPASHASSVLTGGPDAPPYGVRLRLRADYPLERLPSDGARVIARALQQYGMILADGGRVPLTAVHDRFTVRKWSEVGVDEDALGAIQVSDMEVVGMEDTRAATGDCERE